MSTVLIQNGTVVNADATVRADVLIDGGIIKEVRPGIPANSVQTVVDATGLLLLPGGIDAHTHLDMPFGGTNSADDFLTGTRAAANSKASGIPSNCRQIAQTSPAAESLKSN